MRASSLLQPETIHISRSKLRQRQRAVLKRARGRTVVVVTARGEADEKCSGPLMEKLRGWLNAQFDERKVEPNSGLGTAISYLLKQIGRAHV